MDCHLSGVHINEVSKFLAESPSVTTQAIELTNPFNAAHPLIILLQLSRVTNYFDVYSPSISEYENEDILKIHLTAEEPPLDPSSSTVFSYSLAHDTIDLTDNDNLETPLSAQIQISIVLIGTVRKLSVEPIVIARK